VAPFVDFISAGPCAMQLMIAVLNTAESITTLDFFISFLNMDEK
jgi:hypothetical protein